VLAPPPEPLRCVALKAKHAVTRACCSQVTPRPYSDEKVANRDIRVWHGAEHGP
jgi:hypothetical protein